MCPFLVTSTDCTMPTTFTSPWLLFAVFMSTEPPRIVDDVTMIFLSFSYLLTNIFLKSSTELLTLISGRLTSYSTWGGTFSSPPLISLSTVFSSM